MLEVLRGLVKISVSLENGFSLAVGSGESVLRIHPRAGVATAALLMAGPWEAGSCLHIPSTQPFSGPLGSDMAAPDPAGERMVWALRMPVQESPSQRERA